jgi:hypothetical protein
VVHLAVSGHRGLSKDTEALVTEELRRIIESKGEVAGISGVFSLFWTPN